MFAQLVEDWKKYDLEEVIKSWDYIEGWDDDWSCHLNNYKGSEYLQESIKFQAILQGYIQKCISDRKWRWSISSFSPLENSNYCIVNVYIHINGKIKVFENRKPAALEALLSAYVSALTYVCGEKK